MSGYVANNRNERLPPAVEVCDGSFDNQPKRPLETSPATTPKPERPAPLGMVFAKSCNVPSGEINYPGFVTPEPLANYGVWAVLNTQTAVSAAGTPLLLVGSSTSGGAIASRLGGSLSLGLMESAGMVAASALVGTILMLIPSSNEGGQDSAFYTREQYHLLTLGRTRAKVHVQELPAGHFSAYGYYTGGKPDWEMAPVIAAQPRGDKFVADLGDGVGLIWTPAADQEEMGIPALEGAPQIPSIWIYPPTEQADQVLVNPIHPPDYRDAIIWFPGTEVQPIYIMLSVRDQPGVVAGQGQDVSGIWLANAGRDLGAPVPTRVADSLRGREFSSFDDFRKAFWIAVSQESSLAGQFNDANRARIEAGLAPRARFADTVGKRRSFELHHEVPIAEGGEVYNVDNINVTTPKRHIDIHRGVE